MRKIIPIFLMVLAGFFSAGFGSGLTAFAADNSGLQITYGTNGIQTLSYNGVVLEDLAKNSGDAFHIWHMRMTDTAGNVLQGGQYGWGEINNGRSWNPATHTMTYTFDWGTESVQFVQNGNNLDMNVTTVNNATNGAVFDGATIYPFVLHFPQLPVGFTDPSYPQESFNTTRPSVEVADYGSGEVAAVTTDASKPLYTGFDPASPANSYFPVISSTYPDNLATFFPHNSRPVAAGQTDSYTVSLRFAPSGTSKSSLAADVYSAWSQQWPSQLNWTDRRIIGTEYLSSSAQGNSSQKSGYANNPRRYFNDSNANDFDVTTPAGLQKFQNRVITQAQSDVQNLTQLGAQGSITWDIEGEEYPQDTSYVCSPDQIAQVSPEMESVITDPSSPYKGMKLDDAYFKIQKDAGFRVGVCIRPQQFTLHADGTASQQYLPTSQVAAQLIRKIKYAHDRWGATLFYVDSSVDSNGGTFDPSIWRQVASAFPDSLIIPEETDPADYQSVAAFQTFIFHNDQGTPSDVYNYYPHAFSANLVNDVDANRLAGARSALTQAIRNGDIIMVHSDYWQDNNPTVVQMYKDAGVSVVAPPVTTPPPTPTPVPVPTPEPTPTPPPISTPIFNPVVPISVQPTGNFDGVKNDGTAFGWASQSSNLSAAITVHFYIDKNAGTLGAVPAGSIVASENRDDIGAHAFNWQIPSSFQDGKAHKIWAWAIDPDDASGSSNVQISNSPQTFTWNQPAPVPTPEPAPTPTPDPVNSTPTPETPTAPSVWVPAAILSPKANQSLSGVVAVSAAINVPLDAAGAYLMVDGQQFGGHIDGQPYTFILDTTALSNGTHTLAVHTHDIGNNSYTTPALTITIANTTGSTPTPTPIVTPTPTPVVTPNPEPAPTPTPTPVVTPAPTPTPTPTPASTNQTAPTVNPLSPGLIMITSPKSGESDSGVIQVTATINANLDAAGSFIFVDGNGYDEHRVTGQPYTYTLDTTHLANGTHSLQVWAHTINNETIISNATMFTVSNGQVKGSSIIHLTQYMTRGSTGTQVTILQQFLKDHGYLTVAPTGVFGTSTQNAVKAFQKANGIAQTGTVGPQTRNLINTAS